ncbi:hypothetical protein AXG93_1052s1210 [Marchantia polymorpha subsp. ruderalis]|uniref:Uncharacterized protein n=1 Tax=Marchantia polymorpha subsp. ruderalis TaxID=1480154 RepID=A0A176VU28_MARPO|nr:hypothetical protein AXG93_1052s1210 [Marchantia polymorpha subsp. ruderalis]
MDLGQGSTFRTPARETHTASRCSFGPESLHHSTSHRDVALSASVASADDEATVVAARGSAVDTWQHRGFASPTAAAHSLPPVVLSSRRRSPPVGPDLTGPYLTVGAKKEREGGEAKEAPRDTERIFMTGLWTGQLERVERIYIPAEGVAGRPCIYAFLAACACLPRSLTVPSPEVVAAAGARGPRQKSERDELKSLPSFVSVSRTLSLSSFLEESAWSEIFFTLERAPRTTRRRAFCCQIAAGDSVV